MGSPVNQPMGALHSVANTGLPGTGYQQGRRYNWDLELYTRALVPHVSKCFVALVTKDNTKQ